MTSRIRWAAAVAAAQERMKGKKREEKEEEYLGLLCLPNEQLGEDKQLLLLFLLQEPFSQIMNWRHLARVTANWILGRAREGAGEKWNWKGELVASHTRTNTRTYSYFSPSVRLRLACLLACIFFCFPWAFYSSVLPGISAESQRLGFDSPLEGWLMIHFVKLKPFSEACSVFWHKEAL